MKRSGRIVFAAVNSLVSLVYIVYSAGNSAGLPEVIFGIITLLLSLYAGLANNAKLGTLCYISSSTMLAFGSFAVGYVGGTRYLIYGGSQNLVLALLGAVVGVVFLILDLAYAASSAQ